MFSYYLKLGWLSIRRNPLLSTLMVAAIAVGIGACMTTITVNYIMSSNPIAHKSDQSRPMPLPQMFYATQQITQTTDTQGTTVFAWIPIGRSSGCIWFSKRGNIFRTASFTIQTKTRAP